MHINYKQTPASTLRFTYEGVSYDLPYGMVEEIYRYQE